MRPLVASLLLALCSVPAQALTYSDWIAGYEGIADATPGGDPDGDGAENLLEYALADMDPTVMDSALAAPEFIFGTRAAETALPSDDPNVVTVHSTTKPPTTGGWYIGVRYKPRAGTSGVRFYPQYSFQSASLNAWLDGRAVFSAPTTADAQGRVIQWMLGAFDASRPAKKAFLRLKVLAD